MDFSAKYRRQLTLRIYVGLLLPPGVALLGWWSSHYLLGMEHILAVFIGGVASAIMLLIISWALVKATSEPVTVLQRVISYATNTSREGFAPNLDTTHLGKDLIKALSLEVYDLASIKDHVGSAPSTQSATTTAAESAQQQFTITQLILDVLATPVLGLDKDQKVIIANKAAADYFNQKESMTGKFFYDVASLSFHTEDSFDTWLESAQTSQITSSHTWERVRHNIDEDTTRQFDMSASLSSGSSTGIEIMVSILDKTEKYSQTDEELNLIALAVHELRTPLTVMRGYIEVFDNELSPTLDPEMRDFMHRMQASSQQLTAFVSNILNVARVEENQLSLTLREENWQEIVLQAMSDLEIRAKVRNIAITVTVDDGLPPVAVDRISIHEVLNNLIDNAIKYSPENTTITVHSSLTDDGLVETTIEDQGIGIPQAVMGDLFQKYHRSHKSRTQVGGTGLGLYLCKALVTAHGGHISVRSKEGEGSTFSFTIVPYATVSTEQKAGEDGIIRGAHGWIKNHSLYRS